MRAGPFVSCTIASARDGSHDEVLTVRVLGVAWGYEAHMGSGKVFFAKVLDGAHQVDLEYIRTAFEEVLYHEYIDDRRGDRVDLDSAFDFFFEQFHQFFLLGLFVFMAKRGYRPRQVQSPFSGLLAVLAIGFALLLVLA